VGGGLVEQPLDEALAVACVQMLADEEGDAVSAIVLYMSMSLDGFIVGPIEGPRTTDSAATPSGVATE
jgi:hypothetical protein